MVIGLHTVLGQNGVHVVKVVAEERNRELVLEVVLIQNHNMVDTSVLGRAWKLTYKPVKPKIVQIVCISFNNLM